VVDSEFRFVGGRLSLNFVMTVTGRYRAGGGEERLARAEHLGRWLQAAELVAEPPPVRPADLVRARELREALHRLLRPDLRDDPQPADVAVVNAWVAHGGLRRVLNDDARSVRLDSRNEVRSCLSDVAADAVDLLAGPMLADVRECELRHCSMLFLDTSRGRRRRWCDMARCGNQQKAARHRRSGGVVADLRRLPDPPG
jgi:predicted RNA-binding Zn ribbon-like protein